MKFKRHPKFRDLKISEDGSEFRFVGEKLEIMDHKIKNGNIIKIVRIVGSQYSVPKLILETYGPEKPDQEHRYYAQYRDGNKENIHPKNLYWSRNHNIPEKKKLKNHSKNSKLNWNQTAGCYRRYKQEGEKLSAIAADFGVSDMTIVRAVKRYEKYLQL